LQHYVLLAMISCSKHEMRLPLANVAWLAIHTHTHPFNGPFSGTTQVSRYQKGKANLDFTGARDSEWQWHQLGCMQVCTSLQTDNHASTPPLSLACHVNLKLIWLWFLEDGSLCDVADV